MSADDSPDPVERVPTDRAAGGFHQRQLGRGFNWLGGAAIAARVVDLVTMIVMLLLLTRAAIGTAALVISVAMIVEAFNGLGIGIALIQARTVSRDQYDTAFWYALAIGLGTGALTLAAAPAIGAAYGIPGMATYFLAVAAKQPLVGAAVVPIALMNRSLQYRRIALVNVAAALAAAVLRLGLAAAGTGAWALVGGYTASGLFVFVGATIVRPFRPRLRARPRLIAAPARFGLRAALADAAEQVFKNVDFLLIGAFYGTAVLAVYRVAFDIAMEPATAVGTLVNRTALPVLSRVGAARVELTAVLAWCLRRVAQLVAPLAACLVLVAAPLTALLHDGHGHSYAAAAGPLRILAVAALLRVLFGPFSTALLGVGRPGAAALLSVLTLALLAGGIALAGATLPPRPGLLAASAVWLAIYPLLGGGAFFLLRRRRAVVAAPLLRALGPPALAVLVFVAVAAPLPLLLPRATGPVFELALTVALGVGCLLELLRRDRVAGTGTP